MRKNLLMLGVALICYSGAFAQRCGMQLMHETKAAHYPGWAQRLNEQRNSLQGMADNYLSQQAAGNNFKTTAASPIPVIFHVVLTSAQLAEIGGTAGVEKRCAMQIDVLNEDFNRQNADSTLIPSGWKPLYGNSGIRFGLAHTDPNGHSTPGYEIKIVTSSGYSDLANAFPQAKTASTGLASWDITKYYNVWCVNFTGAAATLLGIAVPKSETGGIGGYPLNELGVCILYKLLGKTTTGAGTFDPTYNLGRTLTHETGHFFEIWHTWGDDNGDCPWTGSMIDDGIADTPPQSDATYGAPAYTITGGTLTDACQMNGPTNTQPIGIASISFMDYTDDDAMYLFTTQQAATMAAQVAPTGESYTLTQHPELLLYPSAVANVTANINIDVYPNPSAGQVNISFNSSESLYDITVSNVMGQVLTKVAGDNKDFYSIGLSGMNKGIYFVKCNFASGSVTRKILLQ